MPGKLLAIGDSITFGAWDTGGGWVARLRAQAHRRWVDGREDQWLVHGLGVPGDTSADVLRRVGAEVDARMLRDPFPAVATLFVGTNDLKRPDGGAPQVEPAAYRGHLHAIVEVLLAKVDRVVLVGLPPVGPGATTRSMADVRAYEAVMAEVARERGLVHVPLSEAFGTEGLDLDGVHPNDDGHRCIADRVWAALG